MITPTQRQFALLEFVRAYVRDRGRPPSIREIAAHLGIKSTNGVVDHLSALERKGYLRRAMHTARGIELTTPGQSELERRAADLRAELEAIEGILKGYANAAA